jgi:hypothetical protein
VICFFFKSKPWRVGWRSNTYPFKNNNTHKTITYPFTKTFNTPQKTQDVNYKEQSSGAGAYLPVAALPKEGKVVLAQCESRLDVGRFQELLEAGMRGAAQVCI